jgi:hypothetical protein
MEKIDNSILPSQTLKLQINDVAFPHISPEEKKTRHQFPVNTISLDFEF